MKVSDLHRFVLPEVVGCPDPVVDQAIIQTTFEFCDKSGAWDELQDPQPMYAGVQDYDIDTQPGAIMLRVREVWVDGRLLQPKPIGEALAFSSTGGSPAFYNAAIDRGQIRVFPAPTTDGGELRVRAVYAPTLTATTLPDFLLQRHAEGIASGAKARLMLMPNVSWANPQLGAYYRDRFTAWMVDARIESLHDRVEGSLRAKPRPFM